MSDSFFVCFLLFVYMCLLVHMCWLVCLTVSVFVCISICVHLFVYMRLFVWSVCVCICVRMCLEPFLCKRACLRPCLRKRVCLRVCIVLPGPFDGKAAMKTPLNRRHQTKEQRCQKISRREGPFCCNRFLILEDVCQEVLRLSVTISPSVSLGFLRQLPLAICYLLIVCVCDI